MTPCVHSDEGEQWNSDSINCVENRIAHDRQNRYIYL